MEDLVPLLIFIVIVVVNLLKFAAEKGVKKKQTPPPSGEAPPRRASSLEAFFEDLAEKLEPQPTELPDWPESRKRPDYLQEMEEFQHAQAEAYEEETSAGIIPMPPPEPALVARKTDKTIPEIQSLDQTASLKSAMKSMPAMIINSRGLRIASTPILRSSSAGRIHFPLTEKATLRKAVIANLIFSPPRAYGAEFENTICK